MLVLAAVPDVQFHKLRRAAGSRFNVAQVSTWDDVLTSIRGRPVELAVVDPLLSGQARSQEIERLRVLFPSLPLMLYTTLTPRTAGVLLALGQRGIQHAVFANYDDHPSRLREVLGQEEARSSSRQLLDQLGDALAPLPSELRWVLEEALRSPGEVQTVGQVAVRARVDRRTCERWFTRVGLPSPRHFLAAARVLYAHRLLQDPGFTIEDVAKRLGYAQTRLCNCTRARTSGSRPAKCACPSTRTRHWRAWSSAFSRPPRPGPPLHERHTSYRPRGGRRSAAAPGAGALALAPRPSRDRRGQRRDGVRATRSRAARRAAARHPPADDVGARPLSRHRASLAGI